MSNAKIIMFECLQGQFIVLAYLQLNSSNIINNVNLKLNHGPKKINLNSTRINSQSNRIEDKCNTKRKGGALEILP